MCGCYSFVVVVDGFIVCCNFYYFSWFCGFEFLLFFYFWLFFCDEYKLLDLFDFILFYIEMEVINFFIIVLGEFLDVSMFLDVIKLSYWCSVVYWEYWMCVGCFYVVYD